MIEYNQVNNMIRTLYLLLALALDVYCTGSQMGIWKREFSRYSLGYYTILSNILVIIYFFVALLNSVFGIFAFINNTVLSFVVMMSITLTFLIYHFLLMPQSAKMWKEGNSDWNPYLPDNLGVHYVCPILMIIYFLIFIDHHDMTVWQSLYWLLVPLCFVFYSIIRVRLGYTMNDEGEHWPYWFMDFDRLGVKAVIRNLIIIVVVFGLLGMLIARIGLWLR